VEVKNGKQVVTVTLPPLNQSLFASVAPAAPVAAAKSVKK
jgi:hypothetical protein